MSDVLSQSEIDDLLAKMQGGGFDEEELKVETKN